MPGSRRSRRGEGEAGRKTHLTNALREVAGSRGENITLRQFCRQLDIPTSHVYRDFDAWADLRIAAGLPPTIDRRTAAAVHTRESLLEALAHLVAETGPDLSVTQFWQRTGISFQPIVRVFGSWREMRLAGGLPPVARRTVTEELSRSRYEVLVELYMIGRHLPYITLIEFCALTEISKLNVTRVGPWTSLRRELGLPLHGSREKAYWWDINKDHVLPYQLTPPDRSTSHLPTVPEEEVEFISPPLGELRAES